MNPIREDLKAFVDGELSQARMEEVRLAVASDLSLQQEVDDMRLLGFEIKRLATEPAVVGKEAVLDKVRRPKAPWWDASRLSGRLAYSACLFLVLGGIGAVLFPVFSQAKESARSEVAMSKADAMAPAAIPAEGADSTLSDLGGRMRGGAGGEGGGKSGAGFNDSNGVQFERKQEVDGVASQPPSRLPDDEGVVTGEVFAEETPSSPPAAFGSTTKPTDDKAKNMRRSNPRPAGAKNPPAMSPAIPDVPRDNRKVVKNADISVKVESAKTALSEAENLAKKLGGYVEGGNLTSVEGQTPTASAVLRVRSDQYEIAMNALRGMGEVLSETSNAQDVTAEHANAVGRLTVLRAEADSYVTMLRGARKIGEIMEIKDRLSQVRQSIASLEAQRKALENQTALSTIRATFTQKESLDEKKKDEDKSGFDETWAKALNGLSRVGEFLGNALIYLFVFAPVWLPPVILFWWLGKKARP